MLLTFSKLLDPLLDQSKLQTIRKNPDRYFRYYKKRKYHPSTKEEYDWNLERAGSIGKLEKNMPFLQVYWKNPRNGGVKMGTATIIGIKEVRTKELTRQDAIRDGFASDTSPLGALLVGLSELHEKALTGDERWAVISFAWLLSPPPDFEDTLIDKGLYPKD